MVGDVTGGGGGHSGGSSGDEDNGQEIRTSAQPLEDMKTQKILQLPLAGEIMR